MIEIDSLFSKLLKQDWEFYRLLFCFSLTFNDIADSQRRLFNFFLKNSINYLTNHNKSYILYHTVKKCIYIAW